MTAQRQATRTNGGHEINDLIQSDPVRHIEPVFEIWRASGRLDIMEIFKLIAVSREEMLANKEEVKELCERLAVLEAAVAPRMARVEYVATWPETVEEPTPPLLFRGFYAISLALTLIFGAFLFLNGMGLKVIHPFLSGAGFLGGLGWLTTAVTDLRDWKIAVGNKTS
jgi:hypothetical protein